MLHSSNLKPRISPIQFLSLAVRLSGGSSQFPPVCGVIYFNSCYVDTIHVYSRIWKLHPLAVRSKFRFACMQLYRFERASKLDLMLTLARLSAVLVGKNE